MAYDPYTYEDVFGQPEVPQYAVEQVAALQAARDRGDFASFPGYYESAIGQIKAGLGAGYASWQPDEVAAPPAQPQPVPSVQTAPSVQAAPSVQPAPAATPRTLVPVQQAPQPTQHHPVWDTIPSQSPAVVAPQAQVVPPTQHHPVWDTIPGQSPAGSLAQAGSPFQQPIQPAQQEAVKSSAEYLAEGMPAVASPGEVAEEVGGPPKAWQLQQKFQALSPEEQASLKGAAWDAAPAAAAGLAALALAWPKTAQEKETERIREEYKPGRAGLAAVRDYQQVTGSRADALGTQALDALFASSAGQGLKSAATFTRNARKAGQFYKDVAGAEQQELARIHQRAEATALAEYKGALGDETASERRKAGLAKTLPGLAAAAGKIQASQATSVYKDALKNMTPDERIAFMKLPLEERIAIVEAYSDVEPPVAAAAPAAEAKEA